VLALVNSYQSVVARYLYDPFANVLDASGPLAGVNLYRYSSKEWHPDSGLVYYGFRHYDPTLQRWINQDPLGETGGINLFGFVRNNPINQVDPNGRNPLLIPLIAALLFLSQSTADPPPPPPPLPVILPSPYPPDPSTPVLRAPDSYGTREFLTGMGVPHLADTEIGPVQHEFAATVITWLFPFGKGKCVAAKGTTLELNAATTWGRAETLADHFARHGADVGAKTANEYANIASRFFQESQAARLPTKIDSQGVIRVFDPKTGTFGSFNPNGTTRTLFKPSSPTYFDRQPGTLVP
jgi:RHS repeat-associated protein